jgi:MFS family permease
VHSYWCFTLLILIQLVNTLQRASISYMYSYPYPERLNDPHYSIRAAIPDFTDERYNYMVGDTFTIIYAFMVLVTGALSDLYSRKTLLCVTVFAWCTCTYLSSFCTTFHQINTLRLIQSFFSSFLGPCSYSLISDWIVP